MVMRMILGSLLCLAALFGAAQQTTTTVGKPGKGTYFGKVDTRKFLPQVDSTSVKALGKPENPSLDEMPFSRKTPILRQERNTLPVGNLTDIARVQREALFRGPEDPFLDPPDPCASVGPDHVVFVVNTRLGFYDKATGTQQFLQDFATFFGNTIETDFIFDPKVVFDHISNRWYVTLLDGLNFSAPAGRSNVLLAVSDDSNPNGTWHMYRIDSTVDYSGTSTWIDYISLGYSKDGIMYGGNSFGFSGGAPGCTFWVIRKSSVLSGGTPVVTEFEDTSAEVWSPQAVENFDPNLTKSYFVNAEFSFGPVNRVQFHRIDNVATTPTKTTSFITVPTFDRPSRDAQSTNGRSLDSLDARSINAVFRNNKIAIAHTIDVSGRPGVRWYDFDVNTTTNAVTLNQSGNVSSGTLDFHMGSVSLNSVGDIALTMTRSSTTIAADIVAVGRKQGDAAGTMGAPVLLESSAGTNYTQGGGRWGDYSSTSVDPSNAISFWAGHMNIRADNEWRTGFFKFNITTPMSIVNTPATVVGGVNTIGTVTLESAANGNTSISLSSNKPAVATVPATVTVNNGQTSANFTITTNTVVTNESVVITATQGGNVKTDTIVVQVGTEPDLSSVTTAQTTIGGGRTVVGTVTLAGPAVGAGHVVTLSDNGSELSVPANVTVPAGQSSATFNVNTVVVNNAVTRTITATKGAIQKTKAVVIVPYTLTNFTINVSSVICGNTATGLVNINTYAPQAGKVITITDNSAALITPTTVTIPNGVGGTTFPIQTTASTVSITRTVTASLNGVSITRNLTLTLPDITKLTAPTNTVQGGQNVQVTVHANGLPGNNFIVNLTSSGAPLSVPATVTFTYAQSTKTFTATTAPTASTQVKFITATRNGRTRTITFTITP